MSHIKKYLSGFIISGGIAAAAYIISRGLPAGILGETLIALILGMLLNPIVCRYEFLNLGINWTSKKILRAGIILAGITLSFSQVIKAGKYALILMAFTLITSFGVGYVCKKFLK